MAALPPNSTARFWVDYVVGANEHTFMVRFNAATVSAFSVAETIADILGFVQSSLPSSWVVLRARVAPAGSDISLPFSLAGTGLAGFAGTNINPLPSNQAPRELVYVGRSPTSGRRVRFSLYGGLFDTPPDYRFGPGETAFAALEIFAALDAASQAGRFVAIDGSAADWYSYVNVNYNSHWESEARG